MVSQWSRTFKMCYQRHICVKSLFHHPHVTPLLGERSITSRVKFHSQTRDNICGGCLNRSSGNNHCKSGHSEVIIWIQSLLSSPCSLLEQSPGQKTQACIGSCQRGHMCYNLGRAEIVHWLVRIRAKIHVSILVTKSIVLVSDPVVFCLYIKMH